MANKKAERRISIKYRIRKKVEGSKERPRLSVFRSNTAIYAQLINDVTGTTIASASSRDIDKTKTSINADTSRKVGQKVAEMAKAQGITEVVFDRNGFLYHGKIKAFAEGAREAGLSF
ncbi:MAG: 50S ribosomal protein L18 [Cytophagales bacterium]|nr:MAG: 50S ribosomal protein L18 [Cytophagales bacterium]TAF62453.1 MAG: 50S ribosomal protein L18 [Cytophagales bacterium]